MQCYLIQTTFCPSLRISNNVAYFINLEGKLCQSKTLRSQAGRFVVPLVNIVSLTAHWKNFSCECITPGWQMCGLPVAVLKLCACINLPTLRDILMCHQPPINQCARHWACRNKVDYSRSLSHLYKTNPCKGRHGWLLNVEENVNNNFKCFCNMISLPCRVCKSMCKQNV